MFLENIENSESKFGAKFIDDDKEIIYLLNTDDDTIRKREINISGTIIEYTWRGEYLVRLRHASQHNTFNPPGFSAVEVKNLYH